jgi:hypothetical protein
VDNELFSGNTSFSNPSVTTPGNDIHRCDDTEGFAYVKTYLLHIAKDSHFALDSQNLCVRLLNGHFRNGPR